CGTGCSLPRWAPLRTYLTAVFSIPVISATLPSRKMTVTLSAPFRYQQVSTCLDDSRPLMLIEGLPTLFSRSTRSMPTANAEKSGGVANFAGAGAAAAGATGVALAGAAGPGFPFSSALAAPASDWPTLSNIFAEDLPAPAAPTA